MKPEMQRMQYTDAQRAEALSLLARYGKAEAARRTGIPVGTIASWGHRNDVSSPPPEEMRARAEALKATIEQRKAGLADTLVGVVERLVRDVFAPTTERKAMAAGAMRQVEIVEIIHDTTTAAERRTTLQAIATAVETIQLLTGGATARIETVSERTPEVEAEIAQVLQLVQSA